jgi:hypothetical protein
MPIRVNTDDVVRFVEHCKKKAPNFELRDGKTDSYLMNVIDGFVWPFNPKFMTDYITTIGGKVYFPDGMIQKNPMGTIEVGSHEFIHAYDVARLTVPLFAFLYLAPQLLAVFALAAYGALVSWVGLLPFAAITLHLLTTDLTFKIRKFTGFPLLVLSVVASVVLSLFFVGLESLWLVAAVLPMAPIPSPGRAWAELRAYGMSIHFEVAVDHRTKLMTKLRQFTTALYYFMWPFADYVREKLRRHEDRARAGDVTDPAYLHVLEFINELRLTQEGRDHA